MNRLIKIDEENIARSSLRISSGIFTIILLIFMAIYIPKYFREYKDLQKSTEDHYTKLLKQGMKNDIDQLESNIKYRVKIYNENIRTTVTDQTNMYYNFANNQYHHYKFEDKFSSKKTLDLILHDFSELFIKESTSLSFIGYKNKIKIYKNGKLFIQESIDWSEFKDKFKIDDLINHKVLSLEDCFNDIIKNGHKTFVDMRYHKALGMYIGKIYCHEIAYEIIEKKITDEINAYYKATSENYTFIYKILKMEGGKEFAEMLVNPNRPDLVGTLLDDDYKDVTGKEFRKEFMADIRNRGESFVTYWYKNPEDTRIYPKTTYFKLLSEFNWVIAKGFYYDEINNIVKKQTSQHLSDFIKRIILLITLMSSALLLYYFTFKIILKKQEKRLKAYKNDLINKNAQLEEEVSKSKARELELENLNKYVSILYDLTPVGIVLVKVKSMVITQINKTALKLIGITKDDIIGKICHESFCPALDGSCPIIETNNSIENAERTLINSKKEIIPILKNAKRITIDNEDYILESFIDITEIKKTQNELIKLRKIAEDANVSKSRFLANMSHEIRTPMNVIMGMSNLLLESESDEEKKDLLDSIKISSESLLNIINDILDLSKIESGKYTLEQIPFNLYELLSSIEDVSLFKAKEKGIKFDIEYSTKELPKYISSDPVRIKQIIINLVGNAIKFTKNGSVKLILKVINKKNDMLDLKFSVADTGIGISKEALKNIFKRFTQADISTTRKYGGTGLGLTICEKLLNLMESKLEVNSIEGKGSEFFFELLVEIPDKIELPKEEKLFSSEIIKLKEKKILIAEDNPLNQKLIAAILNQKELNFSIANNGKEAIDMLNIEPFDIVLMDGQMPVMDGLEATKVIRNSDKDYSDIPIIALTASALIGDRQKFLESGMNDYISKPIDTAELFHKLLVYTIDGKIDHKQEYIDNSKKSNVFSNKNTNKIINILDFEDKKKIFEKNVYTNILNMLIADFDKKIDLINEYLESNDIESLKLQTHSLKGIITNFDAPMMNDLSKELDKLAIDGNISKLRVNLDMISTIAPQYKSEILEFIETL
ncbi:MAG: ATP-binding protein [Candidatus Delongbacteria bacterium]|jgi:PAS domain S-box-containing protein|nr:ATP-binding protein [Candidatus Delongbacteria bacterium]